MAASRFSFASATAVVSAVVASAISLAVDFGSSNNFCKFEIASATAASFETGAVWSKAVCASVRACSWLACAVSSAVCNAAIALVISFVNAVFVSVAAAVMISCKFLIAATTLGSSD